MDNVKISGETRCIGESQGFLNVSIRDTMQRHGHHGYIPVMVTRWQPTPEEIAAIVQGKSVILEQWGTSFPPMMLYVGMPMPETDGNG